MEEVRAYKNEHGIWIYNHLPEGMRVANYEDFLDADGELIIGQKFLAQSFHHSRYEAHLSRDNFFSKWSVWLSASHVFIKA